MDAVAEFAAAGGPVVGICNGFQVLTEAGLLPGRAAEERGPQVPVRDRSSSGSRRRRLGAHRRGASVGRRAAHPDQPLRGQLRLRRRRRSASCGPTTGSWSATSTTPTAASTTSPASATRPATSSASCRTPSAACDALLGSRRRRRAAAVAARRGGAGVSSRLRSTLEPGVIPAFLSTSAGDAELAPRGVGDALALPRTSAPSSRSRPRAPRGRPWRRSASSSCCEVHALLHAAGAAGAADASRELGVDRGEALLDRVRRALAAPLRAGSARAPRGSSAPPGPRTRPSASAALCCVGHRARLACVWPWLLTRRQSMSARRVIRCQSPDDRLHLSNGRRSIGHASRYSRRLRLDRVSGVDRRTEPSPSTGSSASPTTSSPRSSSELGREPTDLELAMYAVMWSEHCSYKSSRAHLGRLPDRGAVGARRPGRGRRRRSTSATASRSRSASRATTTRRRSSRTRARPPASAASSATSSRWARGRSR